MSTSDKVLSVLRLFSSDQPQWSVESAAVALGLTHSTAYAYFRSLIHSELIAPTGVGRYVLGSAVIEMDRIARASDPVLVIGGAVLERMVEDAPTEMVALLCRLYRSKVMCVDQRSSREAHFAVSYERGRLMPLFKGAASKVILANIERRRAKRLFEDNVDEVTANGLGKSWAEFRLSLRRIRSHEIFITRGELDPERIGLSVPLLNDAGSSLGSLSLVATEEDYKKSEGLQQNLRSRLLCAASALRIAISDSTANR